MKRFIKIVLIYAAIIAGILCVLNAAYKPAEGEEHKFSAVPDGIELCNFGSSHGSDAYRYDETDAVCFNFSLSAQTLSYDQRILECYRSRLADGAHVIITVSHFSFYGPDETTQSDFASKNRRYYSFLPEDFIKEYDKKTAFYVKYLPLLLIPANQYMTNFLNRVSGLELIPFDAVEDESQLLAEASSDGYAKYKDYIKDRLKGDGGRYLNFAELDALYTIIEICREEGAIPVMITTPFMKEYNDAVAENDPLFYEDFYGIVNEVSRETGVPYYDYSQDERFSESYALFSDTTHLNKEGGLKFTEIVLEEVVNK